MTCTILGPTRIILSGLDRPVPDYDHPWIRYTAFRRFHLSFYGWKNSRQYGGEIGKRFVMEGLFHVFQPIFGAIIQFSGLPPLFDSVIANPCALAAAVAVWIEQNGSDRHDRMR